MLVVDNCSLSALHRINHLFLLKCLFSEVLVPLAVQQEFSHRWQERLDAYPFLLKEIAPPTPEHIQKNEQFTQLGRGEQECILWSLETKSLLASDDLQVRILSRKLDITIIGTLGLCKLAFSRGCFKDLISYHKVIDLLADDLYLSPDLINWVKKI